MVNKRKKSIKKQIISHHENLKFKIDEKGYLKENEDNLLFDYPNWEEIKNEIKYGNGGEINSRDRAKFKAVHSSCVLCVNNFALVKYHKKNVSLFGTSGFDDAFFEKKFPTFLGSPVNLDFYLTNDNFKIGIESKFIETVQSKLPNKNLESYIDHKCLPKNLQKNFNSVINNYIDFREKMHLDVAQLIKGLIALTLFSINDHEKITKLIYLYWVPLNYQNINIYQKHEEELKEFKDQIKDCPIKFESYSYIEFWKMLEKEKILHDSVKKIRERYAFEIDYS